MINSSVSLPLSGPNRGSLIVTTNHQASPSHLSSIYGTRGSFSNSSSPGTPSYAGGAYNDGSFSPISPITTAPISSSSMSIFLGMSSSSSAPVGTADFTSHVQSYTQQSYDLASRVTTNSATINPAPFSQALLNVMTDKSAANQSFTDLASPTKVQVSSLLPSKANSVSCGFSEPSTPLHYDHSPLSANNSVNMAFYSNPSSPTTKVPASTNFSSLLNLQTVPTSMTKNDNPSVSVVYTGSENLTKNLVNQNFVLPSTPMTDLTAQFLSGGDQKPPSSSLLTDNLMNIMALKDLKDQSFTEIESPIRKRPTHLETSGNLLNLHQQQPTQEDIQNIVKEFTPKNNLLQDIVKEFTPKNSATQDIVKELTPKNQDIQNIVKEFGSNASHSRKGSSSASLSTHHSSKQGERKTSLNEEEVGISKNPSNFSNSQQVQMILKEFGTKTSSLAEIIQIPLSAGLKSEGLASYLEAKKESDKSSGPNSIQDLGYKAFELPKSGISTPTHNHNASSLAFGRLLSLNSPMHHHIYPQSEGSSPFHAAFSTGASGKIVVKSVPNGFKEQLKKKGMEAQAQETEFNSLSKQYLNKNFKKPTKIDAISNAYQRVLMKKNMRKKSKRFMKNQI